MTASAADGEPPRKIGLVLAGGGARGAYEMGALRELLPWLAKQLKPEDGWPADIDPENWRPHIIVGTSVGALNAAYLAATAEKSLQTSLGDGCKIWQQIEWRKAARNLLSPSGIAAGAAAALDALNVSDIRAHRLLDPRPLRKTLLEGPLIDQQKRGIPFGKISQNVRELKELESAAVVTTLASTSLSRVFYDGRDEAPKPDDRRGIEYVNTSLQVDHVMASAAIPVAFPPVQVDKEWYYDGGTRLNTPIKPAIDFGATHLIIVALHSLELGDVLPPGPEPEPQPELLDGAKQLIQGLLVDPLVNDLHTLAEINQIVNALPGKKIKVPPTPTRPQGKTYSEIPYIVVSPDVRAIGKCAAATYQDHDHKFLDNVAILHRGLDIDGDSSRGELLSYLYFDKHFGSALVDLGGEDATKLINRIKGGELPLWQTGPPA